MRKLIQTVSPWTRRELRMKGDDAMRTQRVFGAWVIGHWPALQPWAGVILPVLAASSLEEASNER